MAANKILLIDDDEGFLESNRELLEAMEYDVRTASNGSDGFALALEYRPDLVILDVMMTYDTEGFDVARKIRSHPDLRNVKMLMVSGIVRDKKLTGPPKPDADWLPVDRILEKPIDPPKLLSEVKRLLLE